MRKKRRREGKTDYKARLALLKSDKCRIVFRKTNRYIIGQAIISEEAKDKIVVGITSKDLLKYGWPKNAQGSLKSLPASYLTGFLLGKRLSKEKIAEGVFDSGLLRNIKKSRIYAFLKGVIDSGIKINANGDIFPGEDRLEGKHMKNKINVKDIKKKVEGEFK